MYVAAAIAKTQATRPAAKIGADADDSGMALDRTLSSNPMMKSVTGMTKSWGSSSMEGLSKRLASIYRK